MKPNKVKIDLLNANTHHLVTDYEADGQSCILVTVPLTTEVKETLIAIGVKENWIESNSFEVSDGGKEIDLTHVGFKVCGAKWWHPTHGFMTYRFE